MTNSNGEIVSVMIDPVGRPFLNMSHCRAAALRQALKRLGFAPDPDIVGEIPQGIEIGDSDEVIVFESGTDADAVQDLLDELSWSMGRIVREVTP